MTTISDHLTILDISYDMIGNSTRQLIKYAACSTCRRSVGPLLHGLGLGGGSILVSAIDM